MGLHMVEMGLYINFINLENTLWYWELTSAIKQLIVVSWTSRKSPSQILEETVIPEQGDTWGQSSCLDKWPSNRAYFTFQNIREWAMSCWCAPELYILFSDCVQSDPTNPRRQFPDRTANVTWTFVLTLTLDGLACDRGLWRLKN